MAYNITLLGTINWNGQYASPFSAYVQSSIINATNVTSTVNMANFQGGGLFYYTTNSTVNISNSTFNGQFNGAQAVGLTGTCTSLWEADSVIISNLYCYSNNTAPAACFVSNMRHTAFSYGGNSYSQWYGLTLAQFQACSGYNINFAVSYTQNAQNMWTYLSLSGIQNTTNAVSSYTFTGSIAVTL
jgi:hypothetical protein